MTFLNFILLTIAISNVCGMIIARDSLLKARASISDLCKQLSTPGPGDKAIESVRRDLNLRVEKIEAHWEEMYAKFSRLQRSETQREARSRRSAEEAPEPLEIPKELTVEQQKQELRRKIHGRG